MRCADYAKDIHASGRHLLDLINDVLDMSRIEMGQYRLREEPVALGEVVRLASTMLAVRAMEGQVSVRVADLSGIVLYADRLALKQIMVNLLANAIKFNRPDGEVRVRIALTGDGRVAVRVADTGVGIPSQDLPRIFERFYRVDKARSRQVGGTGLGLSIVRHVIERMNGTVTVESQVGKGTTFQVLLPERVTQS